MDFHLFLEQLINGVAWGSIYALIALGYTMVYGVLQLINFAHGDVYMVGAFAGYYMAMYLGRGAAPPVVCTVAVFAAAVLVCTVLGVVIERLAYRPLRNAPRLAALITAIGVSLFLEYGGQLAFGADPKFFPQVIVARNVMSVAGVEISNQQLLIFVVSVVMMVGLQFLILKTRPGRAMRAVSYDMHAASLMGVDVDRTIAITFALGSALAAVAGVLVALSNPRIDPIMGLTPGIKAFVAAVLGGIGNVPGAMLGGLLMGVAEYMVVGYVSSTYRDAIAFALLILILLFRPTGLLGKGMVEKV